MRLKTKPLKDAMNTMAQLVKRSPNIPCLAYVKLETQGSVLDITGTDLDVWATYSCDVEGHLEAPILLPLKAFRAALKAHKDTHIDIMPAKTEGSETFDRVTRAICPHSAHVGSTSLLTLPLEDYPVAPQPTQPLFASKLLPSALLDRALIACTPEESHYFLNAVHVTSGGLRSTDGHRLMLVNQPLEVPEPFFFFHLAAKLLARVSKKAHVSFAVTEELVTAQSGPWYIRHKRDVDSQFPNTSKVIPKDHKASLAFSRVAMLEALTAVLPFTDDRSHCVRFEITEAGVDLSGTDHEKGSTHQHVPCEVSAATPKKLIPIGFNIDYLIQLLKTVDEPLIGFTWKDGEGPVTLKAANWLYVLMPMRL
jgi:DNA polymerase III sliding clamp (beta) subunit (PCNA family)